MPEIYSTPPFDLDVPLASFRRDIDVARAAMTTTHRGASGTITVGDLTLPVQSWEMVTSDAPRAPTGDTMMAPASWSGDFRVTWHPPLAARSLVARSRRRIGGEWVTVKAY